MYVCVCVLIWVKRSWSCQQRIGSTHIQICIHVFSIVNWNKSTCYSAQLWRSKQTYPRTLLCFPMLTCVCVYAWTPHDGMTCCKCNHQQLNNYNATWMIGQVEFEMAGSAAEFCAKWCLYTYNNTRQIHTNIHIYMYKYIYKHIDRYIHGEANLSPGQNHWKANKQWLQHHAPTTTTHCVMHACMHTRMSYG